MVVMMMTRVLGCVLCVSRFVLFPILDPGLWTYMLIEALLDMASGISPWVSFVERRWPGPLIALIYRY